MDKAAQAVIRGAEANLKASDQGLGAAIAAAKEITCKADKLDMERRVLANITERLEERDARSKWDWAMLGCAMLVSAALAAARAVYFTKQELDTASFADAISLIQNDDDAYWCGSTQASIVQDNQGTHYCAIAMPNYTEPEAAE